MYDHKRFAVYYAPPARSALARFGAAWLGWDAEAGARVAHPACDGPALDIASLTAAPRKYGFHGTLKPPFRLARGRDPAELETAVAALAGDQAAFDAPPLMLRRLGRFIALVPSARCPRLVALAAAAVRELDPFRRPAGPAEMARRRAAGLTPAQERNLTEWGYPYVLDEFRFHLTLTGSLADPEAEAAMAALSTLTEPLCGDALPVRDICLFGERPDGFFQIIRRYALTG